MKDSLEKNLEPVETRFEYLRIPKKILYASIEPLSKIVYALFMLDKTYTLREVSRILCKKSTNSWCSRTIQELRQNHFISCEKNEVYNMVLLVDDTECIEVPFELLYKMNGSALIFYAILKDNQYSNSFEVFEQITNIGSNPNTLKNYLSLYKKLKLI